MNTQIMNNVISHIREDLAAKYGAAYTDETFNAVLAQHQADATLTDFIPVLVEAEMNNRLSAA